MGIAPQTILIPKGGIFLTSQDNSIVPRQTWSTETFPHMVTGATEEICHNLHTMTATQEEIPYCSPTTSSGKQKKARSTSQTTISPVRIPLRQLRQTRFCWPFLQLATNSNSANFNNNFSRISKLPKSPNNDNAYV